MDQSKLDTISLKLLEDLVNKFSEKKQCDETEIKDFTKEYNELLEKCKNSIDQENHEIEKLKE